MNEMKLTVDDLLLRELLPPPLPPLLFLEGYASYHLTNVLLSVSENLSV